MQHALPLLGTSRRHRVIVKHITTGLILTVFVVAGSTYNPFAKELSRALTPLSLLFLSELLTLLFTVGSFGLLPILRQLLSVDRRKLCVLLLIGLTSGTLAPLLWFWGLSSTSAVNASLFGNFENVFLILMAILFLHERWSPSHLIATLTISLGVLTITLHGFQSSIVIQRGDIFILLACVTFGIGSMLYRLFLHTEGIQITLFTRSVTALTTFFIVSPFLAAPLGEQLRHFPLLLLPALLGFAFIARFLNVYTFYISLERVPVSVVSLVGALHIVGGAAMAHFFLGESLHWYHYQGGALILLGTLLIEAKGLFSQLEHIEAYLLQRLHHRV